MIVKGFSFIKNAVKMQYPIAEALRSIMPLCDEIVVAVGHSEDGTRELVASLGDKIRIIDTVWDTALTAAGQVLAAETDKAFQAIGNDADWCIYIQGDEVLHEDGIPALKKSMLDYKDDTGVDGLLLKYRHFFGSYEYIGIESHWYRNEIRVIKNDKNIFSFRDAQGFRKKPNEKLRVKPVEAYIHHYGWVQHPSIMKKKQDYKKVIYLNEEETHDNVVVAADYPFTLVNALQEYKGTHPAVMEDRIRNVNFSFRYEGRKNRMPLKDRFKNLLEKMTGRRWFDYQNYKVV